MAQKTLLPPQDVVMKWNELKVIKWLKKVQLDDCIPAFENRHIDGKKLLELTEQKLFSFQDMKIKHRGQIAKCVNECKSQASNAKRIVGTIKQHKSKERTPITTVENDICCESDDDFDYWDSDFDEDFDDEELCEENCNLQVNSSLQSETLIRNDDESKSTNGCIADSSQIRFIPKPPDVSLVACNGSKPRHGNLRPPLKRPPSQPPPPPVTEKNKGIFLENPTEDYEIPISASNSPVFQTNDCDSTLSESSLSGTTTPAETYEIIESPESNYEVVESPPLPSKSNERPTLPPRMMLPPTPSEPPPLPLKPKKFQEASATDNGFRSLNRPKLPIKPDGESVQENPSSIGAALLNTLLGRRNSSPSFSPPLSSVSNEINVSLAGNSQTIQNTEKEVQSMATRPLPPVPLVSNKELFVAETDLRLFPWFHEMERETAEQTVRDLYLDGSFVVRPSKRAGKDNPFTVTVLQDARVFHLNIRQRPDKLFALGKQKMKEKSFESVPSLIRYHQSEPILLTSRGESAGQTILKAFPEKKCQQSDS